MKTYRISVDWQVHGTILVPAKSLEEAIKRIETNDEIIFPIKHENVESSLEVNYDIVQEMYPDEKIGNEPPRANENDSLTCPDCGGEMGTHNLSCSIW